MFKTKYDQILTFNTNISRNISPSSVKEKYPCTGYPTQLAFTIVE